jgi:uncharacterized protein YbjT (DUF2867 family)
MFDFAARWAYDAAKKHGVEHCVYMSAVGASESSPLGMAKEQRAGELIIEASFPKWTHVRPSFFHSNVLWQAGGVKSGSVYAPCGDRSKKMSQVAPEDIGEAMGIALTHEGHHGKAYALDDGVPMSWEEQIELVGKAIGKDVKYVEVPEAAWQSEASKYMDAWNVDHIRQLYFLIRQGWGAAPSADLKTLLGHSPIIFADWIKNNTAAFH